MPPSKTEPWGRASSNKDIERQAEELVGSSKRVGFMSLTSFLAIPDVHQKFRDTIYIESLPKIATIKAQPLTNNYSLVGTAFDYLLRFYLHRINPKAISKRWVALDAAELAKLMLEAKGDEKTIKKIGSLLVYSIKNFIKYQKDGKITKELLKSTIYLAQLDVIYRAGIIDPNLGKVAEGDLRDLKNLLAIVPSDAFRTKKICVLNPTFGEGSQLVGGADTDILLDDTLIDIKTTKDPKFTTRMLHQIMGYYVLSIIGSIDGTPQNYKIRQLGIYFSRSGQLVTIQAKDIKLKEDLNLFVEWFRKRAKKEFKSQI